MSSWPIIPSPCRNPKSNLPNRSQTSSSTARVSISTASNTPRTTRRSTRCRLSRRAKLSTWLTLQVNVLLTILTDYIMSRVWRACWSVGVLMFSRRYRLHPSQHGQTQSNLSSRLKNRLLQLQPSAHVERRLPDRYVSAHRNPAVSICVV